MKNSTSGTRLSPAVYADGSLVLELVPDAEKQKGRTSSLKEGDQTHLEDKIYRLYSDREKPDMYWLLVLGTASLTVRLLPGTAFFRDCSTAFLRKARLASFGSKTVSTRSLFTPEEISQIIYSTPSFPGSERVTVKWMKGIFDSLADSIRAGLRDFKGTLDEYLSMISPTGVHSDRVHFHLVENPLDELRPFAFLATYSTLDDTGKLSHLPLSVAVKALDGERKKLLGLLAAVHRVAKQSAFIRELLDTGELFQPIALTVDEAHLFLDETGLYEAAGILCKIPKWWYSRRRSVKLGITLGKKPSALSADSLLDVDLKILIDGAELSHDDIEQILSQSAPLAMIKGKWIAVDRDSLEKIRRQFIQARNFAEENGLTIREAIKHILEQKIEGIEEDIPVEISAGEWLSSLLEKLKNPPAASSGSLPRGLKATLRPYQKQGFQWLRFLSEMGFGGCLADDMGLGKTVQMIAFLLYRKKTLPDVPHLVVVPTSLLENWKQELTRFAPDISCGILHSSGMRDTEARESVNRLDILLTTYGMCSKTKWLTDCSFDCIVLDEAQAIKNPQTSQSKAARNLNGNIRFIITGTPVENRLQDLWSLFDFANPGLLGTSTEFSRYLKRAEASPEGYGRLRQVIAPYILRRMKTDKRIIDDLPEKIESKVFASLSGKQIALYSHLVERFAFDLENAKGPARRGLILGYIQKFKQLCNHPDHYTGAGNYSDKDSGKFGRLIELCRKIRDDREKVLIFTQFTEIIDALDRHLEDVFMSPGVILTGSMSVKERKESVTRFQNDPSCQYFILSVRAGGVGLNLTAASQVIHFDRWWNPAVENQATDRAFRIGQNRKVLVHKFITTHTVEEKIDRILEDKSALAADVVCSGESAINGLSNSEIISLFSYTLNQERCHVT